MVSKCLMMLHPIMLRIKPYPSWERLRIAAEVLLLGTVTFRGEISSLDGLPQHPVLRRDSDP